MRILIINTSDNTGGAAVAAHRLMDALNNNGVKARMLVRDKRSDDLSVIALKRQWLQKWRFLWERLNIYLHLRMKKEHLFEIDIANTGAAVTRTREFKEADVIHLSWVNQGMLSLSGLQAILRSGKPVVWTMHDTWPATALCHYTRGCCRYKTHCADCPLLAGAGSGSNDLAARTWKKKQQALANSTIYFVACSRWLEGLARQSALLKKHKITNIPNPIDTRVFRPDDKAAARRQAGLPEGGHILLFVAQKVTDPRKGMPLFIEAIKKLKEKHHNLADNTSIAILGAAAEEIAAQLPLPTHQLGYVSNEKDIVAIYNSADLYVTPSLEDNLPNTIMEAMACGVPTVGFRVGGIPEMIDHRKNGYVADLRNADDLAEGMAWVLTEANPQTLKQECVRKVAHNYSESSVAMRYIEIYNEAIAMKHFSL